MKRNGYGNWELGVKGSEFLIVETYGGLSTELRVNTSEI